MLPEQKQLIRHEQKQRRADLSSNDKQAYDTLIYEQIRHCNAVMTAETVFIYLAAETEISTKKLIQLFHLEKKQVVVPKIVNSRMLAVAFSAGDKLETGQLGILTPASATEYTQQIDVCLTPGLGFSEDGRRIGYGKGYYDKWFACHDVKQKIGLSYEYLLRNDIPTDIDDVLMDAIVTEQRLIPLNPQ